VSNIVCGIRGEIFNNDDMNDIFEIHDIQSHSGAARDAYIRACITGSCGLITWAIFAYAKQNDVSNSPYDFRTSQPTSRCLEYAK